MVIIQMALWVINLYLSHRNGMIQIQTVTAITVMVYYRILVQMWPDFPLKIDLDVLIVI